MSAQDSSDRPSFFARKRKKLRRARDNWRAFVKVGARFTPYLEGRKRLMAFAFVSAVGFTLMRLLEPWPIKLIIDNVLLDSPAPWFMPESWTAANGDPLPLLAVLIGSILFIAFLRGLFYYHQRLSTARLGIEIVSDLRLDLYRHIQRLPLSYHDNRQTGDVIVRLTSDIRLLRQAFVALPLQMLESVLIIIGLTIVMMFMDWQLTILALLLLPVLSLLVRSYHRPMKRAARQQREREGSLATMASEALGAIRVVQGFRRERHEIRRFGGANKGSRRSEVKAARFDAELQWATELSIAIVTAVVVGLASFRILEAALTPGDLIVFIVYLRAFVRPLRRMTRSTMRIARSTAAGERTLQILETEPEVTDRPEAVDTGKLTGDIRFEGVSFGYGRRKPVLNGLDLHIEAGERVALVGATGAGKSTIASLIPRFYDPDEGSVVMDGQDIRDYTLSSLRKQIGLVFQEPLLFATSVAENIAYGKPNATQEDVIAAAEQAGIAGHIKQMHDGYDTVISERGTTLSGGQRQCISIARAMIRQSPIVILDEPTTGLDGESAELVMAALKRLMEGRTVIIISHDMNVVRRADRVVLIEAGRVAAEGPPDTLLGPDGALRVFQQPRAG
jgi:ATP-binding cassette subfamily B protein